MKFITTLLLAAAMALGAADAVFAHMPEYKTKMRPMPEQSMRWSGKHPAAMVCTGHPLATRSQK